MANPKIKPNVTLPGTGIAIKRKNIKKVDIHFSFKVEYGADIENGDFYDVIDMNFLNTGIHVSSLSWNGYVSSFVQIQSLNFNEATFGRTGLKFTSLGTFARAYTDDLLAGGSWPIRNKEIFQPSSIFTIDIYGADYI